MELIPCLTQLLKCLLFLYLWAISPLVLSYAETAPQTVINLNSQPLVSALSQLSKQSKIQIFVRDSFNPRD